MYTRIYWIEQFEKGSLGIMPRPSGNEQLEEEIVRLKKLGVDVLVSMLTAAEIHEMGLRKEAELCQKQQIEFINFPIEDRQVPVSSEKIKLLAENIDNALSEHKKVMIHCRGGIGRVTLLAGLVLFRRGYTTNQALEKIRSVRGVPVPDTEEQVHWLRKMEK